MKRRHYGLPRSASYHRWDGTQNPFPFTAEDLLEELGDDILAYGDVQAAIRRMMYNGAQVGPERMEGIREMLRKIANRRRELLEKYDPSGVLGEISERLDAIEELERSGIERRLNEADALDAVGSEADRQAVKDFRDKAAERSAQLDLMPKDVPGRMDSMRDYDFVDDEARQKFNELLEELKEKAAQMYFQQASGALKAMTPEDIERMKNMFSELNQMLEDRAAGKEPDFEGFMDRYGDLFPEEPGSLDELLEAMARRMAMSQAIMASMSQEMKDELSSLMQGLLDDLDLQFEANRLADNLRDAFPDSPWKQRMLFKGDQPLDFAEMADVAAEIADLQELGEMLEGSYNPAQLEEVDLDRVRDLLGDDAARSLAQLKEIAETLKDSGLINRSGERLELTPKGMRAIGSSAVEEIFKRLQRDRSGLHDAHHLGHGVERAYESKPWEWGDPFQLDVHQTVRNAIRRSGSGTPVKITPEDFEIEQTEHLVNSATALLLDLSLSMMISGSFLAAKKLAFALHSLIASQFPKDYFTVIGFSIVAHEIKPNELANASWDGDYGTNLQHALLLARKELSRRRAINKQIIVVTDGEPTAHIEGGVPFFSYPPLMRTLEETLKEVVRCTREDINMNVFMIEQDDSDIRGLRRFVEQMTKINKGRAFFTKPGHLGDFVLVDFIDSHVRHKKARH
ncbi:MAG: hypothetical protein DCC49_12800 [Acidobacteria bacterium]|nr:MAG: hypothetical protein DCC49_12800 [Acidobacteriota bacterium]